MKTGPYLKSVRSALPESARDNLDMAFAGNALAARRLMVAAPRRLRGHLACLAYQLRIGNPAYREIVKAAWAHDARDLLTTFWPKQMLRRLLARAEFQIPEFRGPISIFQPVRGGSIKKAAAELCWSMSRVVATRAAANSAVARPRVLHAIIDPAEIIYWSNLHGASEIVGRHAIERFVVELARPAGRAVEKAGGNAELLSSHESSQRSIRKPRRSDVERLVPERLTDSLSSRAHCLPHPEDTPAAPVSIREGPQQPVNAMQPVRRSRLHPGRQHDRGKVGS